jgi:Fe2+ or Zn2+ uptake regulation protein
MRVLMEEGSKTSLGSVYRQVRELEQAGLLCKVWLAGRTGRRTAYQLNTGALPPPRLLLVCAECQVNLGPASDTLRAALAQLLADQGWAAQPLSVQIECPSVSRCGHGLKTGAGRIPEPPAA